jgi:hypothetical protein
VGRVKKRRSADSVDTTEDVFTAFGGSDEGRERERESGLLSLEQLGPL